ncbi:MAG TPA: fibronectin type III domain-containing protein, partial [Pyrinomonadaceae bacterium]|nr:fibronectin type III domain-containing protein [Pyrinomonadaceae bacterium]
TPIKWEANKEPDLAGYEIVWRDTTAPLWTNAQPVGNVLTFTMKGMSKDNYFFGVRAVDKDGNRSPVTYPRPLPRAPRPNQTTTTEPGTPPVE